MDEKLASPETYYTFFAHYKKGPLLILLRIFRFRLSLCHFFSRNAFFETFTVRQIQRMMKSQFHCSRKIRFLRERWAAPPFDECLARVFFSQLPHKTRGFYRTLLRVTFIEGERRGQKVALEVNTHSYSWVSWGTIFPTSMLTRHFLRACLLAFFYTTLYHKLC